MALKPYRRAFPRLDDNNHAQTSDFDPSYNCIGHAAGTRQWWEPAPILGGPLYWPPGAPREKTIAAYMAAYATLGYCECPDGTFEEGFEKVALFALNGSPSHAARQLDRRLWTSKLGRSEDISHGLADLEGPVYGNVVRYMKRPKSAG